MTEVQQNRGGPVPVAGMRFCYPCALAIKKAALTAGQDIILDQPRTAVTRGLHMPLAQLGPVDVCWDHLDVVEFRPAAPSVDGATGVPLLGGPR